MDSALLLFLTLAVIAIVTAAGMVLSRNAIYAALFLILNFTTVALLYLILGAPFIALAQITVYAGAIMVLFLFVIMLLGAEKLPTGEQIGWQRPLALGLGLILLVEGAYIIVARGGSLAGMPALTSGFGDPKQIGLTLFNQYLLPFEVTSVILLVAVVGAIVLTQTDMTRRELRAEQIRRLRRESGDLPVQQEAAELAFEQQRPGAVEVSPTEPDAAAAQDTQPGSNAGSNG